ncbi:electron carrier/ protein disulfide oxidoreductase [Anaeramoeba flamelloides]|uniref:Electron carrier/ protein disulfide oxidoreductase n=1 Tax=Anaeramoeba flamelloides TaxID=1746091 RepID=A0ABQ8XM40_9EUKA|nr:electron carrier/ protein disulfide oxidoreductase [Anaeramoeba flamelloides]
MSLRSPKKTLHLSSMFFKKKSKRKEKEKEKEKEGSKTPRGQLTHNQLIRKIQSLEYDYETFVRRRDLLLQGTARILLLKKNKELLKKIEKLEFEKTSTERKLQSLFRSVNRIENKFGQKRMATDEDWKHEYKIRKVTRLESKIRELQNTDLCLSLMETMQRKQQKLIDYTKYTNKLRTNLELAKEEKQKALDILGYYISSGVLHNKELERLALSKTLEQINRSCRKIMFSLGQFKGKTPFRSISNFDQLQRLQAKYKISSNENQQIVSQIRHYKQYLHTDEEGNENEIENKLSNITKKKNTDVSDNVSGSDRESDSGDKLKNTDEKMIIDPNSSQSFSSQMKKKTKKRRKKKSISKLESMSMDDFTVFQSKKSKLKSRSPLISNETGSLGNNDYINSFNDKKTNIRREKSLTDLTSVKNVLNANSDSTSDYIKGNQNNDNDDIYNDNFNTKGHSNNQINNYTNKKNVKEDLSKIIKKNQSKIEISKRNSLYTEKEEEEGNDQKKIDSLEMLLSIPIAIAYFKEFLCQELNQENIMFFQQVKIFKQESNTKKQIRKNAKKIINKYIKPGSLFEINIISQSRKRILKQHKEENYDLNMFDKAQEAVFYHMKLNSWRPFLETNSYKNLIKLDSTVNLYSKQKTCKLIYNKIKKKSLNEDYAYCKLRKPRNGYIVGEEIIVSLLDLLNTFYSVSKTKINLKNISQSISFRKFVKKTGELTNIKLKKLPFKERMCFFLNLYNTLTLHSFIINGIPTDKNNVKTFLKNSIYKINNHYFSLNDIYHGILRGNCHPTNSNGNYWPSEEIEKIDLRVRPTDPRIHFALIHFNFISFIRIFRVETLEQNLDQSNKQILPSLIKYQNQNLFLPKIFRNYHKDFGGEDMIITWISSILQEHFKFYNKNIVSLKFTHDSFIEPLVFVDLKQTLSRKFSKFCIFDEK